MIMVTDEANNPDPDWAAAPPVVAEEAEGHQASAPAAAPDDDQVRAPTAAEAVPEREADASASPPGGDELGGDEDEDNTHPNPSVPLDLPDHRSMISGALTLPPGAARDAALLAALRGVAAELECAEREQRRAERRLESARRMFDWAADALSGYAKAEEPSALPSDDGEGEEVAAGGDQGGAARKRGRKRKVGGLDYEHEFRNPDEGPLTMPPVATSGGNLTEEQVGAHREAFYRRLCGVSPADLASFVPPAHMPNVRTRAQLDECVHVAEHWDQGTEDSDVMEFRRRNKSFYTKMKVCDDNIGRRTGHHTREVVAEGEEGWGGTRRKAFCRYGKSRESLMYVALEDLYDAIFEIHSLTGHRGWNACKKTANAKYANVPQDQIRCFVETCPVCSSTRRLAVKQKRPSDLGIEQDSVNFD
ncbi:hypothetical protein ACHAWF_012743 [Thalassiosira exigua]